MDLKIVNVQQMKTLEDYATALITCAASLRTFEKMNVLAVRAGILDEDEMECATTICWEFRRLQMLHKTQLDNILERTEMTKDDIEKSLKKLMKPTKPRKKNEVYRRSARAK